MYHVGFNHNFQLHAAKTVVLYTNLRGSTGYGYDFANAIQNAYPGNDYDDIMAGVDEVISKGYIDEKKCTYMAVRWWCINKLDCWKQIDLPQLQLTTP